MEHICQQGMHLVSRVHAQLKYVSPKKVTGHAKAGEVMSGGEYCSVVVAGW